MKIFGYGSLLCIDSVQKTVPEAKIEKIVELPGYRRVFNFKSPYRVSDSGTYSSVLNIEPDKSLTIKGVLISIDDNHLEMLRKREEGYEEMEIGLSENANAITYLAKDITPYSFQYNDPLQNEYLEICLSAAKKLGIEDNFIKTTYIDNKTIEEIGIENIL